MLSSRMSASVGRRCLVSPLRKPNLTCPFYTCRLGPLLSKRPSQFNHNTRHVTAYSNIASTNTPVAPKSTDHSASILQHEAGLAQDDAPVRYEPPKSGFLSYLPSSFVPYAELIRIDKPVGTYYLLFPCIFSTLLAAPLASPITAPSTVLATSALFATGALVMRGAGCTINDLWDRNLDPKVARTRLRPIARGAVSPEAAIIFTGCQLLTGLAVLLQFPIECFFYATPSLLLVSAYPLAKRVTNYPQAVLGLTFSWGAIMGFSALGVDLLSNHAALTAAACLYSSNIAWTILYDMIYAHQDIKDDAKAGIKSIALRHEKNTKAVLSGLAVVHATLLAAAGAAIGAGPIFYVGTCGGALLTTANMIWRVRLSSVKNCW
ncbi:para-hydroxybenzoate-polyprenyltransferase Coq2, partial [Aureobasidium sp. EXF-8845]